MDTVEKEEAIALREEAGSVVVPTTRKQPRGLENFPASEMVIPRLSLVQPSSRVGTPGMLHFSNTGEERNEIKAVFLYMSRSRVYFEGGVMRCRSDDANVPSPLVPDPISEVCLTCPMAKWGEGKTPPQCQEHWNLLGVEPGDTMPFVLSVHGMSIAPTRRFLSVFREKGKDLFAAVVRVYTEEKENTKGRFFQIAFDIVEWIDNPETDLAIRQCEDAIKGATSEEERAILDKKLHALADRKLRERERLAPYEELYERLVAADARVNARLGAEEEDTLTPEVDEEVPF